MRLTDFLDRAAALWPDRVAFVDGVFRPSYREVAQLTQRIASGLASAGLMPGDRVAILSENDARAFIVMLAAQRAGGIYVPLNARNTTAANADLLNGTGAKFLVLHESFAALGEELRREARSVRLTIGVEEDFGDCDYARLAASDGPVPDLPDDPHRVMTILPTG